MKSTLFKFAYDQYKNFWWIYLLAIISLFATHYIGAQLPYYAKSLADMYTEKGPSVDTMSFVWLALGILIFRTASRLLFFYPARVMERNLRQGLVARIENTAPLRYKKFNSGQLYQTICQDTEQIRALIGFALLQICNILIATIVLVPKLGAFSIKLLWALTPMCLATLIFTAAAAFTVKYRKASFDAAGEVSNLIIETYQGKKSIKNFHAEKSFYQIFQKFSAKELGLIFKSGNIVSLSMPLIGLGVGTSFLWGSYIINENALGANALVLFMGFTFLFLEPLSFLSWIGVVFGSSQAAWKRIQNLLISLGTEDLLEVKLKEINKKSKPECYKVLLWEKEITLRTDVGLRNILVGPTGSGKTYLLLQLAQVLKQRGESLSYVAQAPYIYNDILLRNIFLGREPNSLEKEKSYALLKIFGLTELAQKRETLFSLEVGEHGKHLSGGQAKRLCLVRSLMSESKILIWDDPFSSVDLILEEQILKLLEEGNYFKGITSYWSSHRLSSVRHCQKVIYITKERGIIEQGNVSELLAQDSQVYEYFKKQMG